MRIEELIWLEDIAQKLLQKPQVQQHEVREILEGEPRFFFVEKGHRPGQDVYAGYGQTQAGRYLVVIFV